MEEHISLKTENFRNFLKKKGYPLEEAATQLGMSRQNLFKLMQREYFKTELSKEIIKVYGNEVLKESDNKIVNKIDTLFTADKVLEVMEENRNLWKLIASSGIKVPANFKFGGLMPTYGTVFFGANNP